MGNKFFLGQDNNNGSDVTFFVSGSHRVTGNKAGVALFGGDLVTSGGLTVRANTSGDFAAKIDNDASAQGHVLKLLTDGNGSGTRILEMEDGDGDTVFRARADGRFGFGPNGVSSMGAGTFVVGIDGGHSSDIAISQRLQHLGDSNTYLEFPTVDKIDLFAGGMEMLSLAEMNQNSYVQVLGGDLSSSTDVNFIVSGSTRSIGTSVPGTAVFGGDVVVSGSLRGRTLHFTHHKYTPGDTSGRYVDFYGDTSNDSSQGTDNNKMNSPFEGSLVKVVYRSTSASGNTTIGLHANPDGQQLLNSTAESTKQLNVGSANTSVTFEFGPDAMYGPGDIVGIRVNPQFDPGTVTLTAVWEFETYK